MAFTPGSSGSGSGTAYRPRRTQVAGAPEPIAPPPAGRAPVDVANAPTGGGGDIDRFMQAIQSQESSGREQVVNDESGAHGLFQIMPENWGPWARSAGLGANAPKTPENQRKIARHVMQGYYDDFGSWDAVAVAWFAGPGRARRYLNGDRSVLELSDGNATVGQYIAKMREGMGSAADSPSPMQNSDEQGSARMWETILSTMSDSVAGGQRSGLEPLASPASFGDSVAQVSGDPSAGAAQDAMSGWGSDGIVSDAEEKPYAEPIEADDGALPNLGDFTPGQNGIPAGLKDNAARGAAAARQVFGFQGDIHGLGDRPNESDHPDGNAIDIMTNDNVAQGQQISEWFVRNREALGVKYVIFNRTIWSSKGNWAPRRMEDRGSPTANHVDHPHISFNAGS